VSRTLLLSPCDRLFDAFDHQMARQGYAGRAILFILDAVGEVDSARVAKGFQRALEAHPTMMSAQAITLLQAWPYWRSPDVPVAPKFKHCDLSTVDNWPKAADEMAQRHAAEASDLTTPPLVSLWHIKGPGSLHRFTFCWPHALMDGQGAQYFISEIHRLADDSPAPYPPILMQDHERLDPLAGYGVVARLKLARQAMRTTSLRAPVQGLSLYESLPDRPTNDRIQRFTRRIWTPDKVRRMRDNARNLCSPGPVLYGRYVAACVLRAVHRIHAEHGRKLPYYAMTFPMQVAGIERRPIPGSFLVWANLKVDADRITDKRSAIEDVDRQVREHFEQRRDLSIWALLWLAGQLRNWQYHLLMGWVTRRQPSVTGYSFFREIEPPIRQFVGAQLTDFWTFGPASLPPGWNPVFSRFGDQWNFTLSWASGAYPERVAERYADLIEEEVFED
jgi:hypothetical protein